MTQKLPNFLAGQWQAGTGAGTPLFDPILGTELVSVDATGLDLAAGFAFAREQGGAALRALTYRQRAGMLASPNLPAKQQVAMRLCSSAGEALPADIGERFTQHFGVQIVDGIGSTEMLHIYLSNQPGKVRYGTTGWPVPGYGIELRDDNGQPVPDGETGDLFINGPSAALLYWGNRDKSRETFQGTWIKSGDKCQRR